MSMTDNEKLLLLFSIVTGAIGLVAGTMTILKWEAEQHSIGEYLQAYPAAPPGDTIFPVYLEDDSRYDSHGRFGTIDQGV